MPFPTEVWADCIALLAPRDLCNVSLVDRTRGALAEEQLYRTISLRCTADGRPSLVKPRVAGALFEYLASQRGHRVAQLVRTLDAGWKKDHGDYDISASLCAALVCLQNLRVLRTGTSVDDDRLEPLLAHHTWPKLREAYFDAALVPRSFKHRHPCLETFRSVFGIEHMGHPDTLGRSKLVNVSVTSPEDCTYLFAEKQLRVSRVDVVTPRDMMTVLVTVLQQCPALQQLNFAWTGIFDEEQIAQDVPMSIRSQVTSLGVWMFPMSDLGELGGSVGEFAGASNLITALSVAFPAMELLDIQYIGVVQDRLKDQRAISIKLAAIFENVVYAYHEWLKPLRYVSFGFTRSIRRSSAHEEFSPYETDCLVLPRAIDDGW